MLIYLTSLFGLYSAYRFPCRYTCIQACKDSKVIGMKDGMLYGDPRVQEYGQGGGEDLRTSKVCAIGENVLMCISDSVWRTLCMLS